MRLPSLSLAALLSCGLPAMAEAPRVATDITPVQSLVARVMQGAGEADVIVRPGMSPHGYAMRPSEARALEQADLVIWMGADLTPWMEHAIETLAGDAAVITLLDNPETHILPTRTGARFEAHDHGDQDEHDHEGDDHADDHADHDDHDDHAHDGDAHDHADDHDDHADDHGDHDDHDGHAHDGTDPHAWLDPQNGERWLGLIAAELSVLDPENAALYTANAKEARAELAALSSDITAQLAPLGDRPFLVFHDAYQYFETRFGLAAAGAVSLSDASDPGPARLTELRTLVDEANIVCAFAEPQFNTAILENVFAGDLRIGQLDPLGLDHPVGPGLYPALLRDMADAMTDCLSDLG
ncbi:zinc ABC transporter substrate-binding protein [Roseovarius sp. PS-C2]|uniref:zinc ABC transporter substrate-binding protein n=1 Tax=Roseovarius sp. PS-C2 TaxID=2820814 RepID=UPI001C0CBDB4|nr:zinc ABC transporter substrate-binding protein [Roseovarius sp. PS-C2]MBU3258945.1 zinc ABC transporter substrate-binding protein [Roseovarius sp. PS-C2]